MSIPDAVMSERTKVDGTLREKENSVDRAEIIANTVCVCVFRCWNLETKID